MSILQGLGLVASSFLLILFIYLLTRVITAAYFRSKREHESIISQLTYAHLKKTFGFDRRKVPREAEK